jgi:hypothetical protein
VQFGVQQHQQSEIQASAEPEVENLAMYRWLQQHPIQEPWSPHGWCLASFAAPELTTRRRASSSAHATGRPSRCEQESRDENTLRVS